MTPLKISPLLKLQVRPNPRRANGRLRIGRKWRAFLLSHGSSDVDIIHDHHSPADMDLIPDAVSSHLSGTRDRDADRYNAGPNSPLSSGTQDRDANRYNAGSNPPNQASGTHRSDTGRETAGPNPSSTSSRSHAGLFAAFNRHRTRKESAPDVIDLEEQSSHRTSDGSEQDTPGIGSTPFDLLDIPFHQPLRRGTSTTLRCTKMWPTFFPLVFLESARLHCRKKNVLVCIFAFGVT